MILRGKQAFWVILLLVLAAMTAGITTGSVHLSLREILQVLISPDESSTSLIIWELRLPRIILAFLVGGLLALAGLLMQALLQNPLADPYVLGTSGGAAVAVLVALMLGVPVALQPLNALLGAGFSTLVLFVITGANINRQRESILLAGIILTTGWGALITFLLTTAPRHDLPGMLYWLVGDLGNEPVLFLPAVVLLIITVLALLLARQMNLLLLGDDFAHTLGIAVAKLRLLLLALAITATSIAVAVAGPIGFVGLVTPHLLRLLTDTDHRWLVPNVILAGGALVIAADLLSRWLIAPRELPVGIFTALIGVPVFLYLLKHQQVSK